MERMRSTGFNVVWPVHPRAAKALKSCKVKHKIITIPPVSYLEMLRITNSAQLVVTDSGGVQKEAFFMHKPCIILREETEWMELIQHKVARLVPPSLASHILEESIEIMSERLEFPEGLYGDGSAAEKIVEHLR
jgi:UDP-N-acetylglucosamine 2-epimerase